MRTSKERVEEEEFGSHLVDSSMDPDPEGGVLKDDGLKPKVDGPMIHGYRPLDHNVPHAGLGIIGHKPGSRRGRLINEGLCLRAPREGVVGLPMLRLRGNIHIHRRDIKALDGCG